MSGEEADVSSDGETSFEDEDVPLPPSPLKEGTDEPFQVVIKGGSPWGFSIQSSSESKSAVVVSNIEVDGKAWQSGELRPGDYLLQVNEVRCMSVQVAQELIDSAFRTLTLLVWRGAGDPLSAPVRSASFLQKTRELSARARQAAVQDDSVLFSESKSSAGRMKPRQRRIESFHGSRRGSTPAGNSPSASASSTPRQSQHVETNSATPPTSSSDATKPVLKGWATEHDLTSSRQPVIMSGSHVTRNVPLSSAKSTPSLNQEDLVNAGTTPRGYNPKTPPAQSNMTKSATDIPEHVNHDIVTSPTSPKSPSWYQQKFPNRSVFDFSSSATSRRSGSPRNSYAGGSPRNSYASGSPRNSFASGSPRNSYAGYSSSYVPSNYPQSPVSGFAPQSLSGSMFSQTFTDSHRSGANSAQNQKPLVSSSRTYSHDDTPTHPANKNYDRRSLPPQALQQYRQEFQKEQKQEAQKHLTSMPVTREEEEVDKEIPDIKPVEPNDLDRRPMYSPPAPPVRDISSLKYVSYSRQNHEKFPSWPVTAAQPPQNLGPPIDTQQGEKNSDSDTKTDSSDKTERIQVQVVKPEGKRSPGADRRGDEGKQNRNQSDPGFKKQPKKSFYTTRKPKEPSVDNTRPEGERFEEFYSQSKPGYPPPKLDPDGHNYGDEKYSIPSPPERDMPGLDEKSLVQKIAAVISPNSGYPPTYHHTFQYNMGAEGNRSLQENTPKSRSYKMPGTYFEQAMNAQNLLHPRSLQGRNMVDSGTSPLQSPTEEKGRFLRTVSANPRSDMVSPKEKGRGVIVTQKPFYNTSTQTDDSLANQFDQTVSENMDQSRHGSVSSTVSAMRSDTSTYSSGIGSMTFSDHSSAPMLRKLSEEFYRGKLSGTVSNEKRLSSASAYDELKSPRSEHLFGELKEAESYSSVVIHAHEPAGLFGRDDGSSPSTGSKPEVSDSDHEHGTDYKYKPRHSMDAGVLLHKNSSSSVMPQRGLNESRFTSESNLSGGGYNQRSHSQSLMQLNRPSSSLGETRNFSQSAYSSSSSSSSRPQGSMEARSSGSRVASDSSTKGDSKSRHGSDSVFYDKSSPVPGDNNQDKNSDNSKTATLGRKESMKMAYGTYDEHHYATPYAHQRNSSEVLSSAAQDPNVSHSRSVSYTDYMPMHYSPVDASRLDKIKEEGSESRWQEAVQKSMSLSRISTSNYANISPDITDNQSRKLSDTEKSESEKKRESKSGLRRFASEQLKPKKHRQDRDPVKTGYSSSGGESSKGSKSDAENVPKTLTNQFMLDSDLKKVQHKALLDFVERKSEKTKNPEGLEPLSVKINDTSPDFPPPAPPESTSPITSLPPQPASPFADITKRYNYTKAQRNESLRRNQSITSNSSRESSSDYMQMKRLEHSHQTEWSRLRSQQESPRPRRPLSIGSDISGIDHQHSLSAGSTPDVEPIHQRSSSETLPKHVLAEQDRQESSLNTVIPAQANSEGMVTSPIYHNLSGSGDYPRRPPPPVPGANDEAPPALPPRSNQRFSSSRSESFLLSRVDQKQQDEMKASYTPDGSSSGGSRWDSSSSGTLKEDAYAQQLRKQARRFSEQHKPISMQVVSTKSTVQVSLSQSYKQEPASVLEAVPVADPSQVASSALTDVKPHVSHHTPPYPRDRITPEPPPMPTPLKNGETEIAVDLNTTADFPPPPPEFMGAGDHEQNDRCADDSYGSYKTRVNPREVGKYKRTTSDSSLLRSHHERHQFQPPTDLSSRDVAEITPNKPPRRKLEVQGRESPTQGYLSNSSGTPSGDSGSQKAGPQVPAFHPVEVTSVQRMPRSVAQPLGNKHSPPPSANSSGSFVSTVVQRPAMNQQERNATPEEPRQSVKDRVKNIEVFTHSPQSSRSSRQGNSVSEEKPADSLEQLENSIKSSDSFQDRLRPVVKRSDPDQADHYKAAERVSAEAAESAKMTPPVPSRTYRQKAGDPPAPEYRKNSFQNRSGPRPFVSKSSESANIHNPLNQNHVVNYKHEPRSETPRSHGHSVPEPQVPARPQTQNWGKSDKYPDQNSNFPSPDSRMVSNEENVQNSSGQNIHKRNYETSFTRPRTSSGSNSSASTESQSDKNVAIFRNRYPGVLPHEQSRGDHSHRTVPRGETPQGQRHPARDQRTPDQNINNSNDSHNWRTNLKHIDNPSKMEANISTETEDSKDSHDWRSNLKHIDSHSAKKQPNVSSESDIKTDNTSQPCDSVPARSQESIPAPEKERPSSHLVTVNHGRQPSAEELECDKKAQELAQVLKDTDKQLSEVLTSDSKKIRMQYLDGILPAETEPVPERRPRTGPRTGSSSEEKEKEDEPTSPMPSNYYVSPPKAMIELEIRKFGDQLTQDIADNDALAQKKEELLQRMIQKVDILKDDRKELMSDIEENESLGRQVVGYVEKKCRNQQEKDKYKSYIEDIDKIIRLLLKLSGLLARAENTIQGLSENTNEKIKKMTYDKRDRLYQQHEDAKELKTDIDRRSEQVETILQECLSPEELDDYHYYIKMKSKYTIQMQELEDKITLGNEQIAALQKSIPNKAMS